MASSTNTQEKGKFSPKKFFANIRRFFKDISGEMKRVVWPSKKQVLNNSAIVIVFMILASVIVGGFDTIMSGLVKLLLSSN